MAIKRSTPLGTRMILFGLSRGTSPARRRTEAIAIVSFLAGGALLVNYAVVRIPPKTDFSRDTQPAPAWLGWTGLALVALATILVFAIAPLLAPKLGRVPPLDDASPGGWVAAAGVLTYWIATTVTFVASPDSEFRGEVWPLALVLTVVVSVAVRRRSAAPRRVGRGDAPSERAPGRPTDHQPSPGSP